MGKYSDQIKSNELTPPKDKIVVIGEDYISNEPTSYTVKYKNNYLAIEVFDSNGKKCFKTKSKMCGIGISDMNDEDILYFNENSIPSVKLISKKEDEKEIARFSSKNTTTQHHKYKVEFTNKTNEICQIINVHCSSTYRSVGVFNGNEKEGAPMICRMIDNSKSNQISCDRIYEAYTSEYTIEIAPNVDNLLMIALMIYIMKVKMYNVRMFHTAVVGGALFHH